MQIPKIEMKHDILAAAEHEFLIHGYQAASLRTIAKKANTTIGNLYNYFSGKEAILDEVMSDAPKELSLIFKKHEEEEWGRFECDLTNMENIIELIDKYIPEAFRYELLLGNRTVILLEGCRGTKYELFQDKIYDIFKDHMMGHLRTIRSEMMGDSELFADCIVTSVLQAIIMIAKNMKSLEEGKNILIQYIKVILVGLIEALDMKEGAINNLRD